MRTVGFSGKISTNCIFPLAVTAKSSQVCREVNAPPSDPTAIVLSCGFAVTLIFFVIAARYHRMRLRKKIPALITPLPTAEGEENPFQSSIHAVPPLPVGKVPVWFYHPLDLLGAALVVLVFGGMAMASVFMQDVQTDALNPSVLAVNIAFQFIMAGVFVSIVIWRVNPVIWLGLRWKNWHWMLLIGPCTVVLMWMLMGALQISGYMKWMESLGAETTQDPVKLLQQSNDPMVLILMTLTAVVAAPLCEEIVFRGYFYPVLKRFSGIWPGMICSAFVFAAAHGNLTALPALFLLGGFLAFIYEKTGSLWAPIAVHFCFNGSNITLLMVARYFNLPLDSAP